MRRAVRCDPDPACRRTRGRLPVRAALAAAFLAVGAATVAASETIELGRIGSRLTIEVRVDGTGPYRFLFDTGSSITTLSPELVARLGLRPSGRRGVTSLSGRERVPVVDLERLQVGRRTLGPVTALILDPEPGRDDVSGLLGQDLLTNWSYHLDYRRALLRLEETPGELALELAGERLPIALDRGRLVLEASGGRRRPGRFLLDSGATTAVLLGASGRRFAAAERGPARIETPALVGDPLRQSAGRRLLLRRLEIGDQTLRRVEAVLVPALPGLPEREETGLLPLHLFRSIYVNQRDGYVVLNPRPRGAAIRFASGSRAPSPASPPPRDRQASHAAPDAADHSVP